MPNFGVSKKSYPLEMVSYKVFLSRDIALYIVKTLSKQNFQTVKDWHNSDREVVLLLSRQAHFTQHNIPALKNLGTDGPKGILQCYNGFYLNSSGF